MKSKYPGLNRHDRKILEDILASQKRDREERDAMISAIGGMMERMGIPSIELADPDGTVHGRIEASKSKDVLCDVHAMGGGTVSIRRGDRIRLWHQDQSRGKWEIEKISQEDSVGVVAFVGPSQFPGMWDLAYRLEKTEGIVSCLVGETMNRVVEKL